MILFLVRDAKGGPVERSGLSSFDFLTLSLLTMYVWWLIDLNHFTVLNMLVLYNSWGNLFHKACTVHPLPIIHFFNFSRILFTSNIPGSGKTVLHISYPNLLGFHDLMGSEHSFTLIILFSNRRALIVLAFFNQESSPLTSLLQMPFLVGCSSSSSFFKGSSKQKFLQYFMKSEGH